MSLTQHDMDMLTGMSYVASLEQRVTEAERLAHILMDAHVVITGGFLIATFCIWLHKVYTRRKRRLVPA